MLITIHEKFCIKNNLRFLFICVCFSCLYHSSSLYALDFDFSKRQSKQKVTIQDSSKKEANDYNDYNGESAELINKLNDKPSNKLEKSNIGTIIKNPLDPIEDIVLIHSKTGFIPTSLRLRKNNSYTIHVVNISSENKNISFILDEFSEHHSIYFGQEKSFAINPKQEGAFQFICPETNKTGKIVVFSSEDKK